MKNFTIVEGFKAFPSLKKEGEVFLPLSDLVNGFEFPIFVNPTTGIAKGWFMRENREFYLNLKEGKLESDNTFFSLKPDDIRWGEDDLYINSSILDKIFPIKSEISSSDLMLKIESLEPMPFEEKLERKKRLKLLESRKFEKTSFDENYIESDENFTWPFLDFGLNFIQSKNSENTNETLSYTLGGNGILFGLDSSFNFYGNTVNDDKFARINLSRYKPKSDFLGFAKFFEAGDISTYDIDLISNPVSGRGFNISTFDEKGTGTQRNLKLQGQLTQGWDVEVYRNNVLLDFSSGDGTGLYDFENLPLQMGLNKFKLIFYGPQGEIREEEKTVYLSPTSVKKGEMSYRFFAQEDVKPVISFNDQEVQGRRMGVNSEYGISDSFSLTSGFVFFDPEKDLAYIQARNSFRGMLGVKTGFSVFRFGLSTAFSEDTNSPAIEGLAEANFKNLNLYANHSEFNGLKTEKSYLDNHYLDSISNFNVRFRIPIPGIISLPFYSRLKIATSVEGLKYEEFINTLSLSWWKFYLSTELKHRENFQQYKEDLVTNFLNLQLGKFSIRGETRYDLNKDLLQSTSLGFNYRNGKKISVQTKWNRITNDDTSQVDNYLMQMSKIFSFGSVSAGVSFSSNDEQTISISYNASLLNNPITNEIFIDEPGLSSQGAIVAQSYLDSNYDGKFSENEEQLSDISYETNGSKTSKKGKSSSEFITGLSPYNLTNVKLNEQSLSEISHFVEKNYASVMSRPGVVTKVNLAVIHLGSIDGKLKLIRDEKTHYLKGIRLFVLNNKNEKIMETLSDSDGDFTFEKLKPGEHTIEFDKNQLEILGYSIPEKISFEIDKETIFKTLPEIIIKDALEEI